MSARTCQGCGCRIKTTKTNLCPQCNPNSMRNRQERDAEERALDDEHFFLFENHLRKKFIPE